MMLGCSKTQFEREHEAAVKDNPWGVELHIRADGDVRKLHVGDMLRFQEFYTAKSPRMWQLEVLDDANSADAANLAYISDGTNTRIEPYATSNSNSGKWRFVVLDTDPLRLPYHPDPSAAFRKVQLPYQPGKYEIYVQTHRLVLRKSGGLDPATHIGYPLTSNDILRIEVVPRDMTSAMDSTSVR